MGEPPKAKAKMLFRNILEMVLLLYRPVPYNTKSRAEQSLKSDH